MEKTTGSKGSNSCPVLESIHVYPVKSCRGLRRSRSEVTDWGLKWDRHWMVVDENHEFITQRSHPELARVRPRLADDRLVLSSPGRPDLEVPDGPPDSEITVEIWGDRVVAGDVGDRAGEWFSDLLEEPCRLVRRLSDHTRPLQVNPRGRAATVGFADSHPFLLVNRDSVQQLNRHLDEPVSYDRFRPNLVVRGTGPFREDRWSRIRIGSVVYDVVRSKPRCKIITLDQVRGEESHPELLRTLGEYRTGPDGILFGRELVHASTGTVVEGTEVEILETKETLDEGEGPIP